MKKISIFSLLVFLFLLGCRGKTTTTVSSTKVSNPTATNTAETITKIEQTSTNVVTTSTKPTTSAVITTTTIGSHSHIWDDGVMTTEGSCDHVGIMTFTCEVCSLTRTIETELLPHTWNEGVVTKESTCLVQGEKTFTCEICKTTKTEPIDKTAHNFVLSEDETSYTCSICKESSPSGKTEIGYTGTNGEIALKDTNSYLFIGSSITNGYDANATVYYSMADMFKEDYLIADYKIFDGKKLQTYENVYLRKISENEQNQNKVSGTYRWYESTITLNDDFTGYLGDEPISYEINSNNIILKSPTGKVYNFKASFNKGDTVYKYAENGYTLSGITEKYSSAGERINPNSSYVYLMKKALNEIKDKKIDYVIIQLSTNDIGQYTAPGSGVHIPFGTISESPKSASELDYNTSYGALEWLIASARETWGAKVIIYTCHMSTGEYNTYKANGYDLSKVQTTYKEMYDACLNIASVYKTGLINLFANKDINIAIHEDASNCLADTLHLKKMGYEKVLWPAFRRYVESMKDGE